MKSEQNLLLVLGSWLEARRNDRRESRRENGHRHSLLRWLTPNGGTLLLVIILVATAQVWAKPLTGTASVSGPSATTINYQGHLANADGSPLTQTGVAMSFAIFDAKTGGNLIWPPTGKEDHAVDVTEGLFSVGLGSETDGGIPASVWQGDRYLEITVAGESLRPRERIRSVPIAGVALTVPDGAITSNKLQPTMTAVTSESDLFLEETFQTAVSTTLTVDRPSRLWLVATGDCETHQGGFANGRIVIDGVQRGPGIHAGVYSPGNENASLRYTASNSYVFDLEPGEHTIGLQFSLHQGVGYTRVYQDHTGFSYLLTSR